MIERKKYPPVDANFWKIDAEAGLSDEEIQADWIAYCDGLEDLLKATPVELKQTMDDSCFDS